MTVHEPILRAHSAQEAVADLATWIGADHATCHLLTGCRTTADNPFVRTTYPPEWVSHYLLNNFVSLDPVLAHGCRTDSAFFWDEVPVGPEHAEVFAAAARFGIGTDGYTVPIVDSLGRRSILSFNAVSRPDRDWRAHITAHAQAIDDAGRDMHLKAVGEAFAEVSSRLSLSPRECECLRWTAQGKSYSEIAIILDLSEHTIRGYLKDARLKMDAVSLAQAVGRAAQHGIL